MGCSNRCHQHWVMESTIECTRDSNFDMWMEVENLSCLYVDCVNAFVRFMRISIQLYFHKH
jgi:hypothetical protein